MTLKITNTLTVPSDAIKAAGPPSVTMNLLQIYDFDDFPFMDFARCSRGWSTSDAQGNLTGLVGSGLSRKFFISAVGDDGSTYGTYLNGDYVMRWDGGASVTVASASNCVVNSQSAGTASLALTFSGNMEVTFNNIDSADPPTNIRIIRASDVEAYDAGQKFRPEFLNLLRGNCYGLRFMDWMRTNNSEVVNWADYPVESWQEWDRVPFSIMIDLCNELGVHGWWCVPHQASDAFVTAMATALNSGLDAGLFADIEYSNETWAFGFSQWGDIGLLAEAEFGVAGLIGTLSWAGKRFVEIMDLVEAVSPTRFRGIIASQGASGGNQNFILDAPQWKTSDPGAYVAPHTRATFFSVTDYFSNATALNEFMAIFDANWDGDRTLIPDAFRQSNEAAMAVTRGYLDGAIARCTATDTVDGLTRSLRFRTYEGGSNHSNPDNNRQGRYFVPIAWVSGADVLFREFRINQFGRVYRSTAAGTTGGTEPTHTDGSTVSDGSVSWQDWTGTVAKIAQNFDLRLQDNSRLSSNVPFPWTANTTFSAGQEVFNTSFVVYTITGNSTSGTTMPTHTVGASTIDGVEYTVVEEAGSDPSLWRASTAYSTGAGFFNSNGTLYTVTSGGTSGATEPTHTTGAVTIDGVEYTAQVQYLNDMRPEFRQWTETYMFDGQMAEHIMSLWRYGKAQGAESPAIWNLNARLSRFGFWGKFQGFNDTGINRVHPIGDMLMSWSRANPVWWTD